MSRSLNKAIFLLLIGLLAVAGFMCPAQSQMLDITPNGIMYLTQADTIQAGKEFTVNVQIQYNGGQLKSEGVRVYFLANDTSVIPAELGTYALTDKGGNASFTFTSNKTGSVSLVAMAMSTNSGVSTDKKFYVIEGAVTTTPTATPIPSPSPSPSPTPTVEASTTATPSAEPTSAATPTIAPTDMAVPTSSPTAGDANAQAIGILTSGILIAAVIIILLAIARIFKKS